MTPLDHMHRQIWLNSALPLIAMSKHRLLNEREVIKDKLYGIL